MLRMPALVSLLFAAPSLLLGLASCSAPCGPCCPPAPCVGSQPPPPYEDPPRPPGGPRPTPPSTAGGWTWLLYIDADTQGGPEIAAVLKDFAAAAGTQGARVFALVDQLPPPKSPSEAGPVAVLNLAPWSEVYLLEVHHQRLEVLEVWDDAGHPMSEEATLARFLRTVAPLIGHDRVALWLFGHGQGWGGLCDDDVRGGDWLTYREIADATAPFAAAAGRPLDLLILSSCYGGCLDAACTLSSAASWLVVSEMRTTQVALLGKAGVERTRQEPSPTGRELGGFLVQRYRGWEGPVGCAADRSQDGACLIETQESETLATALAEVLADLVPHLAQPQDPYRLATVAARTLSEVKASIACCELNGCPNEPSCPKSCSFELSCCMCDLGVFLRSLGEQLSQDDPLMPKIEAALIALDRCVLCRSTGEVQTDFGGLSVFLPCCVQDIEFYAQGRACPPGWAEFLQAFLVHGCVAEEPVIPQFLSEPAAERRAGLAQPSAMLRLAAAPKDRPAAARWFSVRRESDQQILLELPLPLRGETPDGAVDARWTARRVASLSDGQTEVIVPLRKTRLLPSGRIYCDQVPMRLRLHEGLEAPSIPVLAAVELSDPGGAIVEGRILDFRTFGARGSRVFQPARGQVLEVDGQRLTVGKSPMRVRWTSLPTSVPTAVGVRVLGALGGLASHYVTWDLETPR